MHKISDIISRLHRLDVNDYNEIDYLSRYAIRILNAYNPVNPIEIKIVAVSLSEIVTSHKKYISRGRKPYTEAKSNLQHYLRDLLHVEVESVPSKIDSTYLDDPDF